MATNLTDEEKRFVEEVGIVFEQTGLTRMSGRIFGWLLISEPSYQSPSEMAEALMASKGSISTTTRLLSQIGLIERVSMPGERHHHFCLRPDALRHLLGHGLEDEIKMFRKLAERGLEALSGENPLTRSRLEEMHDTYSFLEQEFPVLLQSLEEKRKTK